MSKRSIHTLIGLAATYLELDTEWHFTGSRDYSETQGHCQFGHSIVTMDTYDISRMSRQCLETIMI
jgi:hypothetical protein